MPNYAKAKGSRFEYDFKNVLQMLGFYCIRAYASIGVADLVFSPPWNPKGNNRALLVQCKFQKSKDYIAPFERDHLSYLQQINSGNVIVAYKDNKKIMVKEWESGNKQSIEEFLLAQYGIPIESYSQILSKYKLHKRPIHLHYVPKEVYINKKGEESEKPISPFADLYSVDIYTPHVPEKYRDKHIYKT